MTTLSKLATLGGGLLATLQLVFQFYQLFLDLHQGVRELGFGAVVGRRRGRGGSGLYGGDGRLQHHQAERDQHHAGGAAHERMAESHEGNQ
jgi:hypothetical protein